MDELISKQLKKDYLNNVDFIYAYFHGAKVICCNENLIVMYFNGTYFIKGTNQQIAKYLNQLPNCKSLVIHNSIFDSLIKDKFKLDKVISAYQYSYLKDDIFPINNPKVKIKLLDKNYLDFIMANYKAPVTKEYLITRLEANVFIGAFIEDEFVGFAGIHSEGTIGFVEVLEQYRRMKIGTMLETTLIANLLKNKEIVYLQVECNNFGSMKFHEKLGFKKADDIISWYE